MHTADNGSYVTWRRAAERRVSTVGCRRLLHQRVQMAREQSYRCVHHRLGCCSSSRRAGWSIRCGRLGPWREEIDRLQWQELAIEFGQGRVVLDPEFKQTRQINQGYAALLLWEVVRGVADVSEPPPPQAQTIPGWLVQRLLVTVGLREDEIRAMTADEAQAAWVAYQARPK